MAKVLKAISDKSAPEITPPQSSVHFAVKIVHKAGTVRLTSKIILSNVLYIPDFRQNLLFIGKFISATGLIVIFLQNGCQFQDPSNKEVVIKAKRYGDLYKFRMPLSLSSIGLNNVVCNSLVQEIVHSVNSSRNNSTTDVQLFHNRLGYSSIEKLRHVNVTSATAIKDFFCESCVLAKHHILPFPRSKSYAHSCFDLIHVDVWGPYKVPTMIGARSFLTVLDDHSRNTWVFLIHNKTQDQCKEFFQSEGIVHQRSIAGRPQQNGRVERKHRHLLDTDRALSQDKNSNGQSIVSTTDNNNSNVGGNIPSTNIPDSVNTEVSTTIVPLTRKSERPRKPSVLLQDYHCPLKNYSVSKPSALHVKVMNSLPNFDKDYIMSLCNVVEANEPYSYNQAKTDPQWIEAMNQELKALEQNETWDLVSLLVDKKAIDDKVYMKPPPVIYKAKSGQDYSLFTRYDDQAHKFLVVLVYVDDVLITRDKLDDITLLKQQLHTQFTIKDLGPISQFLCQPREPHLLAAQHVLKYLKGTINVSLFYPANNSCQLRAYYDADWATCAFSSRTLSGYFLFLGKSLISWKTKKQNTVSTSSTEAEYMSMSLITLQKLFGLFGLF
ncbi:uncharacterized protein LOC141607365 [Silene latifolia]|uniref:uncharacterized protein LOC141607365 n=1 Tax=Silene latifolia TaxID=37657 RepID=UPI003D781E45